MAEILICSVIYIIIATQMETNHTTANTASNSNARIHSILAIVGIVTAIICSMVLLSDQRSEKTEASLGNMSISTITKQIVNQNDVSLITKIQSIINF
jgi:hypothetical protein